MTDNDTIRAYATAFCRQHGLVPLDAADEERIVMLAQRAVSAGTAIPRQADKAFEPMIEFKVLDFIAERDAD